MAAQGSARLSSMRFMLRGRTSETGGAASGTASGAARGAPLPAEAAGPAGGGGAAPRLVCVRDTASTAASSLDMALMDNGGMVAGRRSCGGANKVVEAAARSAYASTRVDDTEVTDADLLRANAGLARASEQGRQRAEAEPAGAGAGKRSSALSGSGGTGQGGPNPKKRRW